MSKVIAVLMAGVLVGAGGYSAVAFDYTLSPGVQVTSKLSPVPTIKSGGGEFYPVVNELTVYGPLDLSAIRLENGDGEQLMVDTATANNLIEHKVKYTDELTLRNVDSGAFLSVPVILTGPMNVGHINFGNGSSGLDASDKTILKAVAREVRDTGLKSIYLVGKSDPTGSDEQNLMISEKRVMAAKKYLESYLALIGVNDFSITTEFLGDFASRGVHNRANAEDRRVEITIYPTL